MTHQDLATLVNHVWVGWFPKMITPESFLYTEMERLLQFIQTEQESKDPWGRFRPLVCFWVACELHCAVKMMSLFDFVKRCQCVVPSMRVNVDSFFSVVHRLLRVTKGNLWTQQASPVGSPFLFSHQIPEMQIDPIGKGAYGEVHLVIQSACAGESDDDKEKEDTMPPTLVVKCFNVTKDGMHSFLREVSSLSRLHRHHCPYLIAARTVCITRSPFHGIVFPYFSRGNLDTELHRSSLFLEGGALLQRMRRYGHQLLQAVQVIHQAGFVHRDIGCFNILVSDDAQHIVLADFGAMRPLNVMAKDHEAWTHPICQMYYRPLEMADSSSAFHSTSYQSSFDMWSVGMVCLDMILGRSTVGGLLAREDLQPTDSSVLQVIKSFIECPDHPFRVTATKRLGTDGVEVVFDQLLAINPSHRADVSTCLGHGFWRANDVPVPLVTTNTPVARACKRFRVSRRVPTKMYRKKKKTH